MSQKEIEIRINNDGSVDIDMMNYHGAGCAADAAEIIDKLGKSVDSNEKPEFRESVNNNQFGCN